VKLPGAETHLQEILLTHVRLKYMFEVVDLFLLFFFIAQQDNTEEKENSVKNG